MKCPHCGVDNPHATREQNAQDPIGKFCRACRINMKLSPVISTSQAQGWLFVGGNALPIRDPPGMNRQEVMEVLRDQTRETTIREVCEILSPVIRGDYSMTAITFLALLLTYTDRQNVLIMFKAPSSTGKSYVPLEIITLFPKEDVIKLAHASPTAFWHELGQAIYETTIDENGRPVARLSHYLVDLERKIVVFKDMPDPRLLEKLRSFISKDEKEAMFKITDRTAGGTHRTKNVVMRGYTTFLYCTARFLSEEQENTRGFILSPEVSREKLESAIQLISEKEADYSFWLENLSKDPKRTWLKQRIQAIRDARIREVNITPEDIKYLQEEFHRRHPDLRPRHCRDYPRLLALAKACALLNLWHRREPSYDPTKYPTPEDAKAAWQRSVENSGVIEAQRIDIDTALELYTLIAESNERGLPPALYEWYQKVLKPLWDADEQPNFRRIARKHVEVHPGEYLSRHRFEKDIAPTLESAGLVTTQSDPNDKRVTIYIPITETKELANHDAT